MNEKPDVVIYHSPCADGTAAAWAIWSRWRDVELIPANYGDGTMPQRPGKNILIVDFSYPRAGLELMAASAKTITILDHHKTAQADLAEFCRPEVRALLPFSILADEGMGHQPVKGLPIQAVFDMEQSGAMLAWLYAHPSNAPPPLIRYVQDRDLWRWAMPQSRETNAWIGTYPLTVESYEEAHVALMNDRTGWIVGAGAAVERYKANLIGEMIEHTTRIMTIGGLEVPVANVWKAFASDAAGILAEESDHGVGATYVDRADGRREFSLRSRGDEAVDVSAIAKSKGGGGHTRAAGFVAPAGWEGEVRGDLPAGVPEEGEGERDQPVGAGDYPFDPDRRAPDGEGTDLDRQSATDDGASGGVAGDRHG